MHFETDIITEKNYYVTIQEIREDIISNITGIIIDDIERINKQYKA
jgi:hypothetical protein